MARAGLISGTVVDRDGRPLAGARVYFASGPGSFPDIAALTGADGQFALSAPTAGTYQVQCQADGFREQTIEVPLTAGETKKIRIELRKA